MKLNSIVKEIIENNNIAKQTDITDILAKKYKIEITQSNISRILKQINAVKVVNKDGSVKYEIHEKLTEISKWASELVKKIDMNDVAVVITTYPAAAGIVAQALDELELENLMATIAGDNAILVIPKDISKTSKLKQDLINLLMAKK